MMNRISGGGGGGDARLILHIGSSGTMLDFTRYQAHIFIYIYIHFFDDAIEGCDCYIEEVGLTADRLHS